MSFIGYLRPKMRPTLTARVARLYSTDPDQISQTRPRNDSATDTYCLCQSQRPEKNADSQRSLQMRNVGPDARAPWVSISLPTRTQEFPSPLHLTVQGSYDRISEVQDYPNRTEEPTQVE